MPPFASLQKGTKIAIIGAFWCLCGLIFGLVTFLNSSSFSFQQQFFTSPPCSAGVLHSATCVATVQATVVQDTLTQRCGYRSCTPYLNASFLIPPSTTASTTIDIQLDGNVSWNPGTPATLQIWNNAITAVTVAGQHFQTTSYPTGTGGERAFYVVALIFFVLGALVITYGLLWKRSP